MRPFLPCLLLLLVTVSAVPLAAAKAGEPTLHILHDVEPGGYTYVGNPNAFGYVLLDADGETTVHKQGHLTVTLNGDVLYETTLDSGHDYDALNTFVVAFPVAGNYTVRGEVPLSSSSTATAEFSGVVVDAPTTVNATLELTTPAEAPPGLPTPMGVRILDPAGQIIPHTDALIEIRRPDDHWLTFRSHLHTHEEAMAFSYLFEEPGEWLVQATGYNAYPTKSSVAFAPITVTKFVDVKAGSPGSPSPPAIPSGAPTRTVTAGPEYSLLVAIDPATSNSPFSRTTISALVFDAKNDAFVQHVDFTAKMTDPFGETEFASDTLHEYDGDYDLSHHTGTPGIHVLTIEAEYDAWKGTAVIPFTVSANTPSGGVPAGVVLLTSEGLESVLDGTMTFHMRNLGGQAVPHSEIDFAVRDASGVLVFQNKIHTHASGDFQVLYRAIETGYIVDLDPLTIHGEATPRYYYGEVGGALQRTVKEGGVLWVAPVVEPATPESRPAEKLPGFEVVMVLAAIAAVAVVALRRRA